jgi:two-component sensor histidine kinase
MCTGALAPCQRPSTDIEIKLESTDRAPREARRFITHHLIDLGYSTLVENATLIVSELVTNSFTAAPGKPIWLDIRRVGSLVLLEVWDCSPVPPSRKPADFLADGGRGLRIVDELCITWGCDTFFCGKVVWVLLG